VSTEFAVAAYNSIAWGSRHASTYALSESIHKMQQTYNNADLIDITGYIDRRDEKNAQSIFAMDLYKFLTSLKISNMQLSLYSYFQEFLDQFGLRSTTLGGFDISKQGF